MFVKMNVDHYTLRTFLLSLPFQTINHIHYFSFFFDAMAFLTFMIIIAYYEHLRINKINRKIKQAYEKRDSGEEVHRAVKAFTEEHNRYCTHITAVNHFWKYQFLAFYCISFPVNLILMHQVLFEFIPLQIRIFYIFGLILNDSQLFGVQYCFALLSIKIHSMYAKLSRLQWCLNRRQMQTKLKLILCFDRLVSRKRIGITMGSIVFTMPLFQMVIIPYINVFLCIISYLDSSKVLSILYSHP